MPQKSSGQPNPEHPSGDCGYTPCPIEFLTELLEKLVDAQIQQSERMAEMRSQVQECHEKMNWIKTQFTNGFRSEIKNHITDELKRHNEFSQEKFQNLITDVAAANRKFDAIRHPKFWIKVLIGVIITVAGATATIVQIYDSWRAKILEEHTKTLILEEQHIKSHDEGAKNVGNSSTRPGQ